MAEAAVRNIVIVGGGTAGWMAAALLARFLDKRYTIHLVESEEIGTVGVGEATIPMLRFVNQALGFDEHDFVRATQGSFKLGIEFDGWLKPGHKYIHAFGAIGRGLGLTAFQHFWLRRQKDGDGRSLWNYSPCALAAYGNSFGPIEAAPGSPPSGFSWAYHFDAGLYAAYLRKFAEQQGVLRTEGKIVHVCLNGGTGNIASVRLDNDREVAGDFFLDCTGFRALLIGGVLQRDYEDWSHWLRCDRAVAVPCAGVTPILPYTRSTARKAGWQWRIPLQHRIGNGHVYCSAHLSDDEAAGTLLANLDGEALAEPRFLKFKTGMRQESWYKNCVAVGLASGFMEPLESTSIHLIQTAVDRFLKFLPGEGLCDADIAEYNRQNRFEWETIRDFLILHYHRNERDEPFWKECAQMPIPGRLQRKIELFEASGRIFREHEELFTEVGWLQVLLGQGVTPRAYHPLADNLDAAQFLEFMELAEKAAKLVAGKAIAHDEYLNRFCKAGS
ncbi:MAG: tryptophan halogenase family protein [Sphingobium sp.]|nr:MAG: tryptophan halogenase family protein [Sphingobium sp.]